MGSKSVKAITSQKQRKKFIYHLLNDLDTLKKMIDNNLFEKDIQRIGAEQELCLVNKNYRPSLNALNILEKLNDSHFTTELALFNLEINLDPLILEKNCFSDLERQLTRLIEKANNAANFFDGDKIILAGILPTLKKKDLIFKNMTPSDRYRVLNEAFKEVRGGDFKLRIRGVDELIINHESILFEACNTSFQVHLQVGLDEIIDKFNWAQVIAGPVLSVMTNSPLLLGRELWSETRIALFQQSIDLRNTSFLVREQKPRVSFGHDWVRESIIEQFTDDVSRYTALVTTDFEEDSMEILQKGIKPELRALNLHNGTLYKWNRVCYGVKDNSAHLRIENRYIPSGPSVKDEIANALFWIGVMQGMPDNYKQIWKILPFSDARGNFINAARTGMNTYFNWFGKGISAKKLAKLYLIPMARKGLQKSNIDTVDIDYYLNIIERRIENNVNGSMWTVRSKRKLRKSVSRDEANILLTYNMHKNQIKNISVDQWKLAKVDFAKISRDKLYKIMTTELFVVNENDLVELVKKIMEWKNISHIPVVNKLNRITGLITRSKLMQINNERAKNDLIVAKDVMEKNLITATPETLIDDAKKIMISNKIGCLPIIDDEELIGMFTKSDLLKINKHANSNE